METDDISYNKGETEMAEKKSLVTASGVV